MKIGHIRVARATEINQKSNGNDGRIIRNYTILLFFI